MIRSIVRYFYLFIHSFIYLFLSCVFKLKISSSYYETNSTCQSQTQITAMLNVPLNVCITSGAYSVFYTSCTGTTLVGNKYLTTLNCMGTATPYTKVLVPTCPLTSAMPTTGFAYNNVNYQVGRGFSTCYLYFYNQCQQTNF